MSQCGYFSCQKGTPKCSHPNNGETYTKMMGDGAKYHPCDWCKKRCNGIYPSQIPKYKGEWEAEILDKNGKPILNLKL